jgi:hypothetical protein
MEDDYTNEHLPLTVDREGSIRRPQAQNVTMLMATLMVDSGTVL